MKVIEFNAPTPDMWVEFYSRYGIELSITSQEDGWVNFKCILPTHTSKDKKQDGAICLNNGHYKCWSQKCQEDYNEILEVDRGPGFKRRFREWISPIEFLFLTQNVPLEEAQRILDDFIFKYKDEASGSNPEKLHLENSSNKFTPSKDWDQEAKIMQQSLKNNVDTDILQYYLKSRGLNLKTVIDAGMGYVEESPTQRDECLVHIYYHNGHVAGIKGRTIDGRKGGVKNSFNTLYLLQTLPKAIQDGVRTVLLCEGESDTLVMKQLLEEFNLHSIPVLGIPGSKFRDEWLRYLKSFTRIIFIGQTDKPSRKLGCYIKELLQSRAEIIDLDFGPMDSGKDIADYILLNPENKQLLIGQLGISTDTLETGIPSYMSSEYLVNQVSNREIKWIIPNLIEADTITLLVGAPKVGKTFLALEMMVSIQYGVPFMDNSEWTPERYLRAILVEEEGSSVRLGRRYKKLLHSYGFKPKDTCGFIHKQQVKLDNTDSVNNLKRIICKENPDLLIFDPYASLHTGNENDAIEASLIMDNLRSLLRVNPGMAIVLIHHSKKRGPKDNSPPEAKGSIGLWGASDLQITLDRVHREGEDLIEMALAGREVGSADKIYLDFMPEDGRHYIQAFKPTLVDKASETVLLEIFQSNPYTEYTIRELKDLTNLSEASMRNALKKLERRVDSIKDPNRFNSSIYKLRERR